jgi:hypothetical protein
VNKTFTYYTDDGDEAEVELPVRMEVCPDCEGHGSVMNEVMRQHAYTREEFEETFWDDEDREAYLTRGGKYDVQCPTCDGRNVVPVVDEPRLAAPQRVIYEQIQKQGDAAARDRADDARTRRMESGDYE